MKPLLFALPGNEVFCARLAAAMQAVFAGDAHDQLRAAGTRAVVTTDTISHSTNAMGVSGLLADAILDLGQNSPDRGR